MSGAPVARAGAAGAVAVSRAADAVPGSVPAPGVPDVSVVICAHTEQRWDDTLAAVASVRAQSLAARETIVVVDHNPVLYERPKSALAGVTVVENREAARPVGRRNTGIAAGPAARSWRSSTTTRWRSRTGWTVPCRPTPIRACWRSVG